MARLLCRCVSMRTKNLRNLAMRSEGQYVSNVVVGTNHPHGNAT